MIYIFLIVIIVETLLFFFKILPKSALRRHLKKRKKIYVGPRFHFEDIANIILDTLGIMKITMEFWYGGVHVDLCWLPYYNGCNKKISTDRVRVTLNAVRSFYYCEFVLKVADSSGTLSL